MRRLAAYPTGFAIPVAILVALLAVACSVSGNPAPPAADRPGPSQPASTQETGAALISPGHIPRSASNLSIERFRPGLEFQASLPARNVTAADESLAFTPDWASGDTGSNRDPAWCIYRFNLDGYTGEDVLHLDWATGYTPQSSAAWYIGFSDFTANAWHWVTGDDVTAVAIPPGLDFVRDDGSAYIVMMMLGTDEYRLHWLRVGPNLEPTAGLTASPSTGPVPLEVSLNGDQSLDLDGSVVGYEWDLDGDGIFNEPGVENDHQGLVAVDHTYLETGTYNPALRVTDDSGAQAVSTTIIDASSTAQLTAGSWGGVLDDSISSAALDSSGNLYFAGSTTSFGAGQADVLIMKYSPAGELVWTRSWGSVGEDRALSLAVQEPGILHIAGLTTIPDGGAVALVLQYTTDGELLDSKVWGSC